MFEFQGVHSIICISNDGPCYVQKIGDGNKKKREVIMCNFFFIVKIEIILFLKFKTKIKTGININNKFDLH